MIEEGYQAQIVKHYDDDHVDNDDAVWQYQTKKLYAITSSNLFTLNLLLFTKGDKEVGGWLGTKTIFFLFVCLLWCFPAI